MSSHISNLHTRSATQRCGTYVYCECDLAGGKAESTTGSRLLCVLAAGVIAAGRSVGFSGAARGAAEFCHALAAVHRTDHGEGVRGLPALCLQPPGFSQRSGRCAECSGRVAKRTASIWSGTPATLAKCAEREHDAR